LGTVKLGDPNYGFSSQINKENFDHIQFLEDVEKLGVNRFDTSPRYGDSESKLGEFFKNKVKKPWVSTKVDSLMVNSKTSVLDIENSVNKSLYNLNVDKIDVLYLHQNDLSIISDPYILEGLQLIQEKNLVDRVGVSIYSYKECEYAISNTLYEYIQVPLNICDISFHDRFIKNDSSKKFVARTIFLQGTILNRGQLSSRIDCGDEILDYLNKIDTIAEWGNISTHKLAIAFVGSLPCVENLLIGTTSIKNLKFNVDSLKHRLSDKLLNNIYELAKEPKKWANPRSWIIK